LSNETALTWLEFAHEVGGALGLDRGLITGRSQEDMGWRAPRPPTCALGSERGSLMPSFDSAIGRFAAGMRQAA
jgi:dTDP-4-dehydrorhamnose reductase